MWGVRAGRGGAANWEAETEAEGEREGGSVLSLHILHKRMRGRTIARLFGVRSCGGNCGREKNRGGLNAS